MEFARIIHSQSGRKVSGRITGSCHQPHRAHQCRESFLTSVCVLEGALCRGGGCWGLVFFHNLSLPQQRAVGKGSKRLMVVQPIPGISGLQAPSCVGDGWGRLGMLQLHFTVVFAFMSERHLHVHLKCLNHQTPFSQNEAQLSQSGPAWEFAPLEGVNVK